MPPEHKTEAPRVVNTSPFWAVYLPAFERILSQAFAAGSDVAAGPVAKASRAGLPVKQAGPVAVVGVMGVLEKRRSWFLDFLGGTSYLSVKASLNAALADSAIHEIMLLVDSPGGSVDGLAETGELVRAVRAKKRVTAFVDGLGASAAYYIASQATEVVSERTSLVGSIGTIAYLYDMSEMYKKAGVKPVVVSTGELKGTGIEGTPVTDEQKAELEKIVNFYGDDFKDAVVQGRRMSPEAVGELATGAVWPAPEAVTNGLIDRIASLEETLAGLTAAVSSRAHTRATWRARRAWAISQGILAG